MMYQYQPSLMQLVDVNSLIQNIILNDVEKNSIEDLIGGGDSTKITNVA